MLINLLAIIWFDIIVPDVVVVVIVIMALQWHFHHSTNNRISYCQQRQTHSALYHIDIYYCYCSPTAGALQQWTSKITIDTLFNNGLNYWICLFELLPMTPDNEIKRRSCAFMLACNQSVKKKNRKRIALNNENVAPVIAMHDLQWD